MAQIARITMGQSPPSKTYNADGIGLPFLQGKAEFGSYHPVPKKWCDSPVKVAPAGAILVSVRAPVGDVNVAPFPCCIGRGLAALEAFDADRDFLFYRLLLSRDQLEARGTGSIFRSINRNVLEEFLLPVPPLPEQLAIARVLRTVQRVREQTEAVIAAVRQLKASLMKHLFTYGPVPIDQADQVRLIETEIGTMPEHCGYAAAPELSSLPEGWSVVPFGAVVDLRRAAVDPKDFLHLRYVGLEHIDSGRMSLARWGDPSHVRSAKTFFHRGDILYGKLRPYLDKAVLSPWEGICSTDILAFAPMPNIDPGYVVNLLHTRRFLARAVATTAGVNHPRTSWSSLRELPVPLPPLPQQRAIARRLRASERKMEAEESRKRALDALFTTFLHALMTGRVRVNRG